MLRIIMLKNVGRYQHCFAKKRFLQRPDIAVDLLSDVTDYGLVQLYEGK